MATKEYTFSDGTNNKVTITYDSTVQDQELTIVADQNNTTEFRKIDIVVEYPNDTSIFATIDYGQNGFIETEQIPSWNYTNPPNQRYRTIQPYTIEVNRQGQLVNRVNGIAYEVREDVLEIIDEGITWTVVEAANYKSASATRDHKYIYKFEDEDREYHEYANFSSDLQVITIDRSDTWEYIRLLTFGYRYIPKPDKKLGYNFNDGEYLHICSQKSVLVQSINSDNINKIVYTRQGTNYGLFNILANKGNTDGGATKWYNNEIYTFTRSETSTGSSRIGKYLNLVDVPSFTGNSYNAQMIGETSTSHLFIGASWGGNIYSTSDTTAIYSLGEYAGSCRVRLTDSTYGYLVAINDKNSNDYLVYLSRPFSSTGSTQLVTLYKINTPLAGYSALPPSANKIVSIEYLEYPTFTGSTADLGYVLLGLNTGRVIIARIGANYNADNIEYLYTSQIDYNVDMILKRNNNGKSIFCVSNNAIRCIKTKNTISELTYDYATFYNSDKVRDISVVSTEDGTEDDIVLLNSNRVVRLKVINNKLASVLTEVFTIPINNALYLDRDYLTGLIYFSNTTNVYMACIYQDQTGSAIETDNIILNNEWGKFTYNVLRSLAKGDGTYHFESGEVISADVWSAYALEAIYVQREEGRLPITDFDFVPYSDFGYYILLEPFNRSTNPVEVEQGKFTILGINRPDQSYPYWDRIQGGANGYSGFRGDSIEDVQVEEVTYYFTGEGSINPTYSSDNFVIELGGTVPLLDRTGTRYEDNLIATRSGTIETTFEYVVTEDPQLFLKAETTASNISQSSYLKLNQGNYIPVGQEIKVSIAPLDETNVIPFFKKRYSSGREDDVRASEFNSVYGATITWTGSSGITSGFELDNGNPVFTFTITEEQFANITNGEININIFIASEEIGLIDLTRNYKLYVYPFSSTSYMARKNIWGTGGQTDAPTGIVLTNNNNVKISSYASNRAYSYYFGVSNFNSGTSNFVRAQLTQSATDNSNVGGILQSESMNRTFHWSNTKIVTTTGAGVTGTVLEQSAEYAIPVYNGENTGVDAGNVLLMLNYSGALLAVNKSQWVDGYAPAIYDISGSRSDTLWYACKSVQDYLFIVHRVASGSLARFYKAETAETVAQVFTFSATSGIISWVATNPTPDSSGIYTSIYTTSTGVIGVITHSLTAIVTRTEYQYSTTNWSIHKRIFFIQDKFYIVGGNSTDDNILITKDGKSIFTINLPTNVSINAADSNGYYIASYNTAQYGNVIQIHKDI